MSLAERAKAAHEAQIEAERLRGEAEKVELRKRAHVAISAWCDNVAGLNVILSEATDTWKGAQVEVELTQDAWLTVSYCEAHQPKVKAKVKPSKELYNDATSVRAMTSQEDVENLADIGKALAQIESTREMIDSRKKEDQ